MSPASPEVPGQNPDGRNDAEPTSRVERGFDSDRTQNVGSQLPKPVGPAAPLAPGATVGGRYRLVNLVGSDTAGNRFWRAKDSVLPRDMALTMLPDTAATSATVARTLRVGRLHHIGLPQTLDVGSEGGQSYVVGQWVDGATLTDLLAGGPLESDVATSITAKVAEAVAEAHRNGIALGAINPSLVRVNFDGQVRLSHVIAHGNATPDQDIRAVGALLYLMLTGTWPLPTGIAGDAASPNVADPTVRLGDTTSVLPAAPTRLGREVPAAEVRPGVPEALSTLAERALHPDEPAGIHAVSAIAALLRRPETTPAPAGPAQPDPERPVQVLSPAEKRLVKERRVKLGVAGVMLAALSALIIIIVASLTKQLMTNIGDPNVASVVTPISGAAQPGTANSSSPGSSSSSSTVATTPTQVASTTPSTSTPPAPPAAGPLKIDSATVFSPDTANDNAGRAPMAIDGNPNTKWMTYYRGHQISGAQNTIGLMLQLDKAAVPTAVTISSTTPGTTFEIRSAPAATATYDQTKLLGAGTSTAQPLTINTNTTGAAPTQYVLVLITKMPPRAGQNDFYANITEVTVTGR